MDFLASIHSASLDSSTIATFEIQSSQLADKETGVTSDFLQNTN